MTNPLTIHDELKSLLPPLTPEEYAGLEASLLKDGCIAPLVAWGDTLVDGHHRYEICSKHGIPFNVRQLEFDSLDDAKLWAGRHQEHRRNLTDYHRAELTLKLKVSIAAKAKERQRCGPGGVLLPQNFAEGKETRQELAGIAGVSHTTLDKVAYIAEHADEGTKEKLRSGEKGTSIHKEYNRLKDEQRQPLPEPDLPPPPFPLRRPSETDFVETVTLTHIPTTDPERLIGLLFDLFTFEFREKLVADLLAQMDIDDGRPAVTRIVAGLTKRFSN